MSGIDAAWIEVLVAWAEGEPRVRSVHVFGSRARGDHRADSDLDVAYQLFDADDETALTTAVCTGPFWQAELQGRLSVPLQLEFADPDEDERVWPAVLREGVLLFERPPPPASGLL